MYHFKCERCICVLFIRYLSVCYANLNLYGLPESTTVWYALLDQFQFSVSGCQFGLIENSIYHMPIWIDRGLSFMFGLLLFGSLRVDL